MKRTIFQVSIPVFFNEKTKMHFFRQVLLKNSRFYLVRHAEKDSGSVSF